MESQSPRVQTTLTLIPRSLQNLKCYSELLQAERKTLLLPPENKYEKKQRTHTPEIANGPKILPELPKNTAPRNLYFNTKRDVNLRFRTRKKKQNQNENSIQKRCQVKVGLFARPGSPASVGRKNLRRFITQPRRTKSWTISVKALCSDPFCLQEDAYFNVGKRCPVRKSVAEKRKSLACHCIDSLARFSRESTLRENLSRKLAR